MNKQLIHKEFEIEMKAKFNHWPVIRTLLFLILGMMNTVLIKPEDIGTWKNYVGYGSLLAAALDTSILIKNNINRLCYEK